MADIQYPVALRFDFEFNKMAKAAGAQWNPTLYQWEARTPAALFKCRKWAPANQQLRVLWKREWLDVPSRAHVSNEQKCSKLGSIPSSSAGTILSAMHLSRQ
jgi:hypothetical protein